MPNAARALKGDYVQFHVRDVHLPEPTALLDELYGSEVLEGKVVDLSDSGEAGGAFLVIEVSGLRQPCIVAIDRILPPSGAPTPIDGSRASGVNRP
jgi:hypothetical protein